MTLMQFCIGVISFFGRNEYRFTDTWKDKCSQVAEQKGGYFCKNAKDFRWFP